MLKLESTDDLEKVVAVCRKTGVSEITVNGIHIKIGPPPDIEPVVRQTKDDGEINHLPLPRLRIGQPPEKEEWADSVRAFELGMSR